MNQKSMIFALFIAICAGYTPATLPMLSKGLTPEKEHEQKVKKLEQKIKANEQKVKANKQKVNDLKQEEQSAHEEYERSKKALIEWEATGKAKELLGPLFETSPIMEKCSQEMMLYNACALGDYQEVIDFIQKGVDINVKSISFVPNFIPILYITVIGQQSIVGRHLDVIKLLLESGADINAELNGITALDIAYFLKNDEIIELLGAHGAHLITEEEAEENQATFFTELNQEEIDSELNELKIENVISTSSTSTTSTTATTSTTTTTSTTSTSGVKPTTSSATRTTKPLKQKHQTQTTKSKSTSDDTNNLYLVLMHEKFKWPKSLNKKQQGTVLNHLRLLRKWPTTTELDIKELKGQKDEFRMRVGGHRIIFSVDTKNREIRIHEIGLRKSIYKKLAM